MVLGGVDSGLQSEAASPGGALALRCLPPPPHSPAIDAVPNGPCPPSTTPGGARPSAGDTYGAVPQHCQSFPLGSAPARPLVPPQGAPGGSGAAWYSQSEAQPLGTPPPPRGLERAASKVAGFTAFDLIMQAPLQGGREAIARRRRGELACRQPGRPLRHDGGPWGLRCWRARFVAAVAAARAAAELVACGGVLLAPMRAVRTVHARVGLARLRRLQLVRQRRQLRELAAGARRLSAPL